MNGLMQMCPNSDRYSLSCFNNTSSGSKASRRFTALFRTILIISVSSSAIFTGCATSSQRYDQGYMQGSNDAIKRQYFLRQELERRRYTAPGPCNEVANESARRRATYYTFPGPDRTADGIKLVPNPITVPIVE